MIKQKATLARIFMESSVTTAVWGTQHAIRSPVMDMSSISGMAVVQTMTLVNTFTIA